MSRTQAMARAHDLRDELQALNVNVSIELQTGRSGGWNGGRFVANLGHHVASRRSQGLTPFLSLIKRGRSDLPGPLANGYGGFDQVARIITMDWANHPGAGGPWTVPGATIPRNNGRPYLFGWEIEGGYSLGDWPSDHREFQARCFAATLRWLKRDERSHGEHGNPWARGRKFDRIWYYQHLDVARREIRAALRGVDPDQEDDLSMLCKRGDSGPAVSALQVRLKQLDHYAGDIDGDYGAKTSQAVLAMRRSVGSSADSGDNFSGWAFAQLAKAEAIHFAADNPLVERADKRTGNQNARILDLERMHYPEGKDNRAEHIPPVASA